MIIVLGCGVTGLSCAWALLDAGYEVEIRASELPPGTTSNVAPALWYPYRVESSARALGWATDSYRHFCQLSEDPAAGIRLTGVLDLARQPVPRPWWSAAVPSLAKLSAAALPAAFRDGHTFETPVIDTRAYMPYLMQQVQKRGARIVRQTIASLTALAGPRTIVVNCTGLGARNLCDDRAVVPIRGQLLRIAGPGPDQVLLDKHDDYTAYIIPRADDCILGATAQVGDDDLEPRSADTNFLLDICAALDPRLCGARILETVVGIRPGRPTIRLEHEALGSGRHVVHNYGHGGAGVTLSWGCATEVVSMVNTLTRR